jgi:hypothetical protein
MNRDSVFWLPSPAVVGQPLMPPEATLLPSMPLSTVHDATPTEGAGVPGDAPGVEGAADPEITLVPVSATGAPLDVAGLPRRAVGASEQ